MVDPSWNPGLLLLELNDIASYATMQDMSDYKEVFSNLANLFWKYFTLDQNQYSAKCIILDPQENFFLMLV